MNDSTQRMDRLCVHCGKSPCLCSENPLARARANVIADMRIRLANTEARLRETRGALRDRTLKVAVPNDFGYCHLCKAGVWEPGQPECHVPGCLNTSEAVTKPDPPGEVAPGHDFVRMGRDADGVFSDGSRTYTHGKTVHRDAGVGDEPSRQVPRNTRVGEFAFIDRKVAAGPTSVSPTELRRRVKLIHDQYMGCGGNLNDSEVVIAMQRECLSLLRDLG